MDKIAILISGKFYGNVANSGTFTVENDNK